MTIRRGIRLRPVRANEGVASRYSNRLHDIIQEMSANFTLHLTRAWKEEQNLVGFASDAAASQVRLLDRVLKRLLPRWTSIWDERGERIVKEFTKTSQSTTDNSLMQSLKSAGWAIKFKPTVASVEAYRLVFANNIALVKSLPQQFMKNVEGAVWRNVMRGFDAGKLTQDIIQETGVSLRHAAFIANDQVRKAQAVFEIERCEQVGIIYGTWQHSDAGRHPRPSHVAADGKRFKLKDGLMLDGRQVWPGTEPNCKCFFVPILPAMDKGK